MLPVKLFSYLRKKKEIALLLHYLDYLLDYHYKMTLAQANTAFPFQTLPKF